MRGNFSTIEVEIKTGEQAYPTPYLPKIRMVLTRDDEQKGFNDRMGVGSTGSKGGILVGGWKEENQGNRNTGWLTSIN
jgi:hypothetical protein